MKRIIVKTADGSETLFVPELGEHYHSIHGAQTESEHIYINAAFKHCSKNDIRVLEYGMGTGLNILLTYIYSTEKNISVQYHTIEKYPLSKSEYMSLDYSGIHGFPGDTLFNNIHKSAWNKSILLSETFSLYKEKKDFREAQAQGGFDVIYFDAFAPEVQMKLWTLSLFKKIFKLTAEGGVLTTYSSKGQVRRNLEDAGFKVEKLPGPPGKREFLRAIRI